VVGLDCGSEMSEGLPAVGGPSLHQQYLHGPFAPEAESPQQVIVGTGVIAHDARRAAGDDGARVLAQVALEAAAGDQPGILAVIGYQDERARLAVSRAGSVHENAECQRPTGGTFAPVERQQWSDCGFHAAPLCQPGAGLPW